MTRKNILIDFSQDLRDESWLLKVVEAEEINTVIANVSYKSLAIRSINGALSDECFLQEQAELAKSLDAAIDAEDKPIPDWLSALGASRTAFWETNLLELHKWLYTIKSVLDQDRHGSVRVYVPVAPTSDRIYLYEAEGETSKQGLSAILYARTDYLLFYIRAYLSTRTEVKQVGYVLPHTKKKAAANGH